MSSFAYKGRDSQGNAVSGVVEAATEMAAVEQLMRRGVMPTELKPGKAKAPPSTGPSCWSGACGWTSWWYSAARCMP